MRSAIKRVTIELTSGAQIVMAPQYQSLPLQFVMPSGDGRLGKILEIGIDELFTILEGIRDAKHDKEQGA